MSAEPLRQLLPSEPSALPVVRLFQQACPERVTPPHPLRDAAAAILGWTSRILVGSLLCFNLAVLSWLSSIVVFGWTYRWMRSLVLYGWWKQSPTRNGATFAEFCDTLEPHCVAARPRFFLGERSDQPSLSALWQNFRLGLVGLFCTFLLTGWGCLMMMWAWEFGWLNSFHKGYEMAWLGPASGWLGMILLAAALVYVPMAQAHQAVTGELRAFFDFRFVGKLIQAKLSWYTAVAGLIFLVSLPLEIIRLLPGWFDQDYPWAIRELFRHQVKAPMWIFGRLYPGLTEAGSGEVLLTLHLFLIQCALIFFPLLLLCRWAAARVYRAAVPEVLRRGWVRPEELHPTLANWLTRLKMVPTPPAHARGGRWRVVRLGWVVVSSLALYGGLMLLWMAFAAKEFGSEFYNYHPFTGFLNHTLIQFPCLDYVPWHLLFPGTEP